MARRDGLAERCQKALLTLGPSSTTEITNWVCANYHHGATINQVGNVLARRVSMFQKLDFVDEVLDAGNRVRICIWGLADE